MTPLHFFRTFSEQLEHGFLNDAIDSMWDFARKWSDLGVTTNEFIVAIIGKDLHITPFPMGHPMSLVPIVFPSHPFGHSKLVTNEPWFRTIAPWWYENEKGFFPLVLQMEPRGGSPEEKVEPPIFFFFWLGALCGRVRRGDS